MPKNVGTGQMLRRRRGQRDVAEEERQKGSGCYLAELERNECRPPKSCIQKKKKIKFNADAGAEAQSECCFVVKLSQRE